MRPTIARALGITAVVALIGSVSLAGASGKFASSEVVVFPSGNLVVTFDERGQNRFSSVDYQLTATADATSCTTVNGETQCFAARTFPTDSATGLVPDQNGRVTGSLTLASGAGGGGTPCGCGTLHMDYSDITLTNQTTGRTYRLEPISADRP